MTKPKKKTVKKPEESPALPVADSLPTGTYETLKVHPAEAERGINFPQIIPKDDRRVGYAVVSDPPFVAQINQVDGLVEELRAQLTTADNRIAKLEAWIKHAILSATLDFSSAAEILKK